MAAQTWDLTLIAAEVWDIELAPPDLAGGYTRIIPTLSINGVEIPLTLTSYTPPNHSPKVGSITTIPLSQPDLSFVYGGQSVSHGSVGFAKAILEGFIDTPTNASDNMRLSTLTDGGIQLTYADLIAACLEGRLATENNIWQKVNPLWFRDPYDRVYNNPTILDFSASYVEGVPNRTQFSMTLKV